MASLLDPVKDTVRRAEYRSLDMIAADVLAKMPAAQRANFLKSPCSGTIRASTPSSERAHLTKRSAPEGFRERPGLWRL